MDPALEEIGWTEDQWNRICTTVTEEAQRVRVAAQILPVVGPEDPSAVAVPAYTLTYPANPAPPPPNHMETSSDPTLYLTSISVLVEVRPREAADPALSAVLSMFRRAANVIARAEDALAFNGRTAGPAGVINRANTLPQIFGINRIPAPALPGLLAGVPVPLLPNPLTGAAIVAAVSTAIGNLDRLGFSAPYACALDHAAFDLICTPGVALVLPRDRILPFLQGGSLVRASAIPPRVVGVRGMVIALGGNPVELVVATDMSVNYLQATASTETRFVFRVSERVALRIKEPGAIAIFT
jgi:uncharacterized linocin/CFP29 family protein